MNSLEEAIAQANGKQAPLGGGDEVVFGGALNDDLVVDEEGALTDASLERVNERGIQRSLAAAIIGVGGAAITAWVRAGRIALNKEGFVPIREVRRMTIEVSLRKKGKASTHESTEVLAGIRLEIAKADKAEIELEKLKGTLVSREAAARAFAECAVVTRSRVMGVADAVTPMVLGKKDHVEVLRIFKEYLQDALETLADAGTA